MQALLADDRVTSGAILRDSEVRSPIPVIGTAFQFPEPDADLGEFWVQDIGAVMRAGHPSLHSPFRTPIPAGDILAKVSPGIAFRAHPGSGIRAIPSVMAGVTEASHVRAMVTADLSEGFVPLQWRQTVIRPVFIDQDHRLLFEVKVVAWLAGPGEDWKCNG